MKRSVVILLFALATSPGAAQQTITRYTVDGGGGRSSSSRYILTGTVGQPDAAPLLRGGRYRLGAGFWTAVPPDGIFTDGFEGG